MSRSRSWLLPVVICAAFVTWALFEHRWNWSAGGYRQLAAGLAIAIVAQGVAAVIRHRRAAEAAVSSLGWSVLLGAATLAIWLSPSAGRDAYCAAPQAYCEDGMLVAIWPVYTVIFAVASAVLAAGGAWLRGRFSRSPP